MVLNEQMILVKAEAETVRYSDIAIRLPAICETCHQEIRDNIHVIGSQVYCHEHIPQVSPDQARARAHEFAERFNLD